MKSALPKSRLSLSVQYAVKSDDMPNRHDMRRWVKAALERDAEITVRVVDASEGQALNLTYRGKDYATNVLTFVYDDMPEAAGLPLMGDIVLCDEVVRREAAEQGKPLAAHYAHLLVHGVLHLQGFDHEEEADANVMEAREIQIVTFLGYDNPYSAMPA